MITVLVVVQSEADLPPLAAGHPSVEVLTARGAEDALEKLARNRRIDAVLLLAGANTREIAEAIREEDPGAPPLFGPASAGTSESVRVLPSGSPESLIDALVHELAADR